MLSMFTRLGYVLRSWANIAALSCVTAVVGTYLVLVAPHTPTKFLAPTTTTTESTTTTTTTKPTTTATTEPTTEPTTESSVTPTESTIEPKTTKTTQFPTITKSQGADGPGRGPGAEVPPGLAMPATTMATVEQTTTTVTTTTTPQTTAPTTTTPPRNKATGFPHADGVKACYYIVDGGTKIQRPCRSG